MRMKSVLIHLVLLIFVSATAYAAHCPPTDFSDCAAAAKTARNPLVPIAGAVAGAATATVIGNRRRSPSEGSWPDDDSTVPPTLDGQESYPPTEEDLGAVFEESADSDGEDESLPSDEPAEEESSPNRIISVSVSVTKTKKKDSSGRS